eukprot:SAG31_NODE_67_length_28318_cov_6.493674_21_plen_83_part_00
MAAGVLPVTSSGPACHWKSLAAAAIYVNDDPVALFMLMIFHWRSREQVCENAGAASAELPLLGTRSNTNMRVRPQPSCFVLN